jgi:guanylate kinase
MSNNKPPCPGNLFVFSAPSGAGKSTLVNALLAADPNLVLSISHTTRPKRPAEQNHEHYHFVSMEDFEASVEAGEFIEHALVFGNYYGTSRKAVEEPLSQGHDVLFEIDWQGARNIKAQYPEACLIFILPPSVASLRHRLENRAQDTNETIARRMREARSEMVHYDEFDYVIVNDDFDNALNDLKCILRSRHLSAEQQQIKQQFLLDELLNNA